MNHSLYLNISFPKNTNRPFFYTNFVTTVDGKAAVTKNSKDYWPIGSKFDHQTLVELRAHADILIHGKNVAKQFNTLDSLSKEEFKLLRKSLKKKPELPYMVITSRPDKNLIKQLENNSPVKPIIVTTNRAVIPTGLNSVAKIWRIGVEKIDFQKLALILKDEGFENCLVEGGPTLLASFFKENLIDEVFLTIAPKIYGGNKNTTLTMLEGFLLPPAKIKHLKIISLNQVEDEVYLRYKVEN